MPWTAAPSGNSLVYRAWAKARAEHVGQWIRQAGGALGQGALDAA